MQQRNIDNVFLNASAGSGKTFALCIRYIALLFGGVKANEILAITFTKKAANEMKERITNNLSVLHLYITEKRKETLALDIMKELDKSYGIDSDVVKHNIDIVYKQFLTSDKKISTIDSFFGSILRKFAFFLGIRRDFETRETTMNDDMFECFLRYMYNDKENYKIFQSLLQNLNIRIQVDFNNTLDIKMLFETLYDKTIEFKTKDDFDRCMNEDYILKNAIGVINDLDLKKCDLKSDFIESCIYKQAKLLSRYIRDNTQENANLQKLCKKFESNDIDILANPLIIKKEHTYIKKYMESNEIFKQDILNFCDYICKLGSIYYMCKESELISGIHKLMCIYEQSIKHAELRDNNLSFDSIKRKVFEITTDTLRIQDVFQSDYFYFLLDSQINHILFDEYQDTNIVQYRIFFPLFDEILSGKGTNDFKSLFFVGDDKQSLYAFRGADIRVFETTKKLINNQTLSHNYRSKKSIVDFVNEKFKEIFKDNYEKQDSLNNKNYGGFVSINLFDQKEEKQEIYEEIYTQVLQQIEKLIENNIQAKEIAILARKRKTLHDFVSFVAPKTNILFNIDKNDYLINQQSIQAIFYAFKINDYKEKLNELNSNNLESKDNKATEKHNVINNLKFAQKKFNKLIGESYFNNRDIKIPKNLSLPKSIKFVMEDLRLYNQDCMELLDIASQNPNIKNIDELFESISNIQSIVMQEEAVSVMSVHSSKGLGFEYVIYIDRDAKTAIRQDKILYDYDNIFLKEIRINTTNSKTKTYIDENLQKLLSKKEENDKKQECNILYVACTRAKSGLYIFANTKSDIAETLKLSQEDSKGDVDNIQRNLIEKNHEIQKPLIINNIKSSKMEQEEFIHEEIEPFYQNNISMLHKQVIGLSLHLFLEIMLGYNAKNPYDIIKSHYGFYIDDKEIKKILTKAQNIFDLKIKDKTSIKELKKNDIKCELSFIQNNNIKRIDAIIKNDDSLYIMEFKSTQKFDNVLLQKHTEQLQTYMKFINDLQVDLKINGYLVYLQDNIIIREITLK